MSRKQQAQELKIKTVRWVDHPNFVAPCTARVARAEFRRLRNEHGQIVPRVLWKSQKKKGAPLHDWFTWDNLEAADKQRDNEARALLGCIVVEYVDDEEPQQLMVRTRTGKHRGYEELPDALADETKELVSLTEARRMVSKLKRRIQHLDKARKLVQAMTLFVAKV